MLCTEHHAIRGERDPASPDLEVARAKIVSHVDTLVGAGWARTTAELFSLLIVRRTALGTSLHERSPRYAASAYALSDALHAERVRQAAKLVNVPNQYTTLIGPNSLSESDPAWQRISTPDDTGFCGLTAMAPVRCSSEPACFSDGGFLTPIALPDGGFSYMLRDSPIVQFEMRADDEHGCHSCVLLQSESNGAFPPNTLYRLKRVIPPGEWTAPGGARPRQTLFVVTATFRAASAVGDEGSHGGKLCEPVTTLTYGNRQAFVQGLHDLTDAPVLTLAQEFSRDQSWRDWKGIRYTLRDCMSYVLGPAQPEECTPGIRDQNNRGKTLEQFISDANEHIAQRRDVLQRLGVQLLPHGYAFLTRDEVLAVRLYSGPAYQPINGFLRAFGALRGEYRKRLACDVGATFCATVRCLCQAIRKLADTTLPEEAAQPLMRGVRGELPASFWLPDEQKMCCAVDVAFMSTSRNRQTPIEYMGSGKNVLWELHPQLQTDAGFHRGADIKILSQFAGEDEVLFPPCTMLEVLSKPIEGAKEPHAPELTSRLQVCENCVEMNKTFLQIQARPSFV